MFKKFVFIIIMVLFTVSCSSGEVAPIEEIDPVAVEEIVLEEAEPVEIAFKINPADCNAVATAMQGAENDVMMFAEGSFLVSNTDEDHDITYVYACDSESGAESIQIMRSQSDLDGGAVRSLLARIDEASPLSIIDAVEGDGFLEIAGQLTYLTQGNGMWSIVIATAIE